MYCIDTSALIAAWEERYPPDLFPRFWENIDGAIQRGLVLSTNEVLEETSKRSRDLNRWLKERDGMFIPLEEDIQLEARSILARFPRLVGARRLRTSADPFVIATARVRDLIVVTEENYQGSLNKPNIPDVCGELDIECIKLLDLIRRENWIS